MVMKYKRILGALLAVVLGVFLVGGAASAAGTFKTGDSPNLAKGEKINSSLYIAGSNVTVAGEVDGDIFCAGQNVDITGIVHGDVICAGQSVRVDASVTGDVRLAGQSVTLGGDVVGNATVAGQTFTTDSKSSVGRDATVMSQHATLNGKVGRDLLANGDNINVNGSVGRDVNGDVRQLELGKSSSVGGDIAYTSKNEVEQAKGSKVGGSVQRSEPMNDHENKGVHVVAPLASGAWLYFLVSMLIVSLAVVLAFPRKVHYVAENILTQPGRTILVGLVASLIVPLIILALMITIVGIPLALLMLLIWFLLLFLSGPIAGYSVGRLLLKQSKQPVPIMLLGSFVVLVVYFIPIIGFFAMLAVVWFGVGAQLSTIYTGHYQKKTGAVRKKKA